MQQVELVRSWRHYRRGHTLPSVPDPVANVLVRRGIGKVVAKQAEPKKPTPEASAQRFGFRSAWREPARRRTRRKRKR